MDARWLQSYLHEHIPLSRAMEVDVLRSDGETVVLCAPLEPNINHKKTAFGGSLSALAMLTAWSALFVRLQAYEQAYEIVIQHNEMAFLKPATDAVQASCRVGRDSAWQRFDNILRRKAAARIGLEVRLEAGGVHVANFSGDFVALRRSPVA